MRDASTRSKVTRAFGRLVPGLVLFTGLVGIYYASPVVVTTDSLYTMLVSEHFLLKGNLAVDEHFSPHVDSSNYPRILPGQTLPRHIRRQQGHLYYMYPPGTPVLSAPFVLLMRSLLGESVVREDNRYRPLIERLWQKRIAAVVTAATCLVLYLAAHLLLSPAAALVVGAAAGLGTQLWSTASRGLWAHTWLNLELALALYLLLRWRLRVGALRPVLLGTLLAAAFCTRPTAATIILPLTLFVVVSDRRMGAWLVATGGTWGALLMMYSYSAFGTVLPPYYLRAQSLSLDTFPTALAGQLLSPSRGLLVFVPLTLMVVYLVARNWRLLSQRDLAITLKRPRFSWTRIKGESNVQGGRRNGSVEGRGTGRGIGADGGSPEGDWSPCRRGGGRGGLPGAGAAVERQPEARRGAAATAWRIAGGAVP